MEGLPASNRFDLVGAGKAVTAVDADANGARLVCGSHDYKCYLYDFGGLKADGKSFRSWEVSVGTCRKCCFLLVGASAVPHARFTSLRSVQCSASWCHPAT